jgi:hypothetical protein
MYSKSGTYKNPSSSTEELQRATNRNLIPPSVCLGANHVDYAYLLNTPMPFHTAFLIPGRTIVNAVKENQQA